jgi:queuine tRNA-ribosyltransferase
MDFSFAVEKTDRSSHARAGVIKTPHGEIRTPAFCVVATRATVRGLDPEDIKKTKSQAVLGNAYHLYLHPGIETIKSFGGFVKWMGWNGPSITDSGGYQVSFLWNRDLKSFGDKNAQVRIRDEGMYFRSHIDGSKHLLTPEKSMVIQNALGADIIMALDQPMGFKFSADANKKAWERTFKWEERSLLAWKELEEERCEGTPQALFGIIQGQTNKKMRMSFLKFILEMGFPGIAIGDETIGADPRVTAKSLDTVKDSLPDNKPLHALGLGGGPEGIFAAVERRVDTFDNSSITRMARTGLLFLYPEDGGRKENKFRMDIKKSVYHSDKKPISKVCKCYTCQNFSRSYVHHLLVSSEILGLSLATIHNIYLINDLMEGIRRAIKNNDLLSLRKHWVGQFGS